MFTFTKPSGFTMLFFKRSRKKQPAEDLELIRLYKQSGDMAVVGELYERYLHLVFGVCMKYLRDEEESKDATMHIFEKLVYELKSHEVNNFKSWLHTLARNHCLMKLRSRTHRDNRDVLRLSAMDEEMEFDIGDHTSEEDLEEHLHQIEKGINELPEEQRRCIELFYLEEKSYKEITEITGYDLKQVKSFLQNGKRNLKIYIERYNE